MVSKDKQLPISQSDVKLYDRQIRLWGMEAQEKLFIYFKNLFIIVTIIITR